MPQCGTAILFFCFFGDMLEMLRVHCPFFRTYDEISFRSYGEILSRQKYTILRGDPLEIGWREKLWDRNRPADSSEEVVCLDLVA